jgi:hypothetical protein
MPSGSPMNFSARQLVRLALKVASGSASPEEEKELETLLEQRPEWRKEVRSLQSEFKVELEASHLELALRAAFGALSSDDRHEIDLLRRRNPKALEEIEFIAYRIDLMARSSKISSPPTSGSMPEEVRRSILEEWKNARRRSGGGS